MFRVKNSNISVPYQSVKIPCRNGLVFNESSQIVWDIPRNVGMADLKNACIECDININGSDNAPALQLIKTHGASSLFNRVSIRSMGRLLEQLDNYNLMTNLKYTASQDKGTLNKRSLCEGCAPSYKMQDNPFTTQNKIIATGETVNNANDTWRYVDRKCQVPLHTGIFQNDKSTPLMALPLEVEIIVEKDVRALYADTNLCNDLGCTALPGAPQTFIELTAVTLAKFGVVGAGNQMAPDAKLNYLSNLPFRVGQRVLVAGGTPGNIVNGGNFNIVSIIENGGLIRLDMGANVNTGASAGVTVSALNNGALMTDAPAAGGHACVAQTVQIEIKNPRLIIPKVMPPENMMKAIGASIMKGKYNFDIVSYTDYQSNIVGTTTNSTTIIPADLSRVKSLLCVPVEQADLNRLDNIRAQQGRYCEADSYEFQINNRMVPSRLVSLTREAHGEFVAGAGNYIGVPDFALGTCVGAVHTYEIEKALGDSGIDVRNLRFLGRTHGNVVDEGYWLVARTLGPYGTSENLMGVSAILYLNYSGNNTNLKLLHNYAVHIRTVAFGPAGVELRY